MKSLSRRKFLNQSLKGLSTVILSSAVAGTSGSFLTFLNSCRSKGPKTRYIPETDKSFPLLEVTGSYYEIGYAIGSFFKKEINDVFNKRKDWFNGLKETVKKDNKELYDGLLLKTRQYFPHLIEEIKGMSKGAGIAFDDMFLMNIKAEIGALRANQKEETPGCSTIYYADNNKMYLIHNEDGNEANRGNMFVVKATPPSGITFIVLTYPGIIMGNGPGFNDFGIIQATNYIASAKWNNGIPRYILGRAVLEAKSINEAINICTHPERAFAYHHNLASINDKKFYSVEVTPENYQIFEPDGIYFHTNHLILNKTKDFPQDEGYVNSSSFSRYSVIKESISDISGLDMINEQKIFSILSSHQNKPYSPCRHPKGKVTGRTLATAFFNINEGSLRLYKGNPCISYPSEKYQTFMF
ncbi:MAG: C45 family peptidase [Bacteroidales bacterium]|nr:C45 family peptidase [Bacteroidales bacterium]